MRSLLLQWGFTVGALSAICPEDGTVTAEDCDLIVAVGPPGADESAIVMVPETTVAVLWVGCERAGGRQRADVRIPLGESGCDPAVLRSALQTCQKQAHEARAGGVADNGREFLHFLGHELRSPLTAVKTALEVLQGDLGGLGEVGEPVSNREGAEANLRMLELALRNVRRLHQTVDWTHDLLALAETRPQVRWSARAMADLVARLSTEFETAADVRCDAESRAQVIDTDPELVCRLVGQVLRVLQCVAPGQSPALHVALTMEPRRSLRLTASLPDNGTNTGPRVQRTSLVSSRVLGAESAGEELERLARFMVSPVLLKQLGAHLDVSAESDPRDIIVLDMPVACHELVATPAGG